jgi:hypothetical protein
MKSYGNKIIAHGTNGAVELIEDKVIITRNSKLAFFTHGMSGEKEILVSRISSIQLKKPSMITAGYIQFAFMGGQEAKGGIVNAVKDENTVMFKKDTFSQFEQVKKAIEEKMSQPATSNKPVTSSLDEIEKLAGLKEKGIITEEEFQAKKTQLLGL